MCLYKVTHVLYLAILGAVSGSATGLLYLWLGYTSMHGYLNVYCYHSKTGLSKTWLFLQKQFVNTAYSNSETKQSACLACAEHHPQCKKRSHTFKSAQLSLECLSPSPRVSWWVSQALQQFTLFQGGKLPEAKAQENIFSSLMFWGRVSLCSPSGF